MPRIDLVATDLPPEYLNEIGIQIYHLWRQWALGYTAIAGKRIEHPTGRLAASIQLRRYGPRIGVSEPGLPIPQRITNHIAIFADEDQAPEAAILETGHEPIDMLEHLRPGRRYPIHRTPDIGFGSYAMFPIGSVGRRQVRRMWSKVRQGSLRAYPMVPEKRGEGTNTSGTGPPWTIPAMPAYAPALHLAELYADVQGLRITVDGETVG